MNAINKGTPFMAAQQRKVKDIQQSAVNRAMNPAAEAEKMKQGQQQGTILGGGQTNRLGG